MVERRAVNADVAGSSPAFGAIFLGGKMPKELTDVEALLLAKEIEFEMNQWLINRLMEYKYRDSLKVIKHVFVFFKQTIINTLGE